MEFYWQIVERDGTITKIPPSKVDTIRRLWTSGQPIRTTVRDIPPAQIKSFHITDEPFTEQRLVEAVAQAFKEPLYTDENSIGCRWVKKHVTQDKWGTFYSKHPGYRMLGDENGMVVIAFQQVIHLIDPSTVSYCNEDEVNKLNKG